MNLSNSADAEVDEGLNILLGLSRDDITCSNWDEEGNNSALNSSSSMSPLRKVNAKAKRDEKRNTECFNLQELKYLPQKVRSFLMERAHAIDPRTGTLCLPPVVPCDFSVFERGNVLIASKSIRKGDIIFTERAQIAAQQKPIQYTGNRICYSARGCQYCYRSLEMGDCLSKGECSSKGESVSFVMPLRQLWPIPDYECIYFNSEDEEKEKYDSQVSKHIPFPGGVYFCKSCDASFCSEKCKRNFFNFFGSCCTLSEIISQILSLDDNDALVLPPIFLAIRIMQSLVILSRQGHSEFQFKQFWSFCGEAQDIQKLELGDHSFSKNESKKSVESFSLERVHKTVTSYLHLTLEEREMFDIEFFNRIVSISARNAIGMTTQSPFTPYYNSLLQFCGRNTNEHKEAIEKLSRLLGSESGLTRQMDDQIRSLCAIEIAGLFSLTAMMNHSCDPSAEVRSQHFVDATIDVVALRNISVGEEVTISYINLHKAAGKNATDTSRRKRDLKSRYLFDCMCHRCNSVV